MAWPISNHGSTDVDLSIPGVTAPHYLWAILQADGEQFRADNYQRVRGYLDTAVKAFSHRSTGGQAPSRDVSDQRLRTWKSEFEEMGLLTVGEDGGVRATRFGRSIIDGFDAVGSVLEGSNRRIAQLGAQVANRVLLAKPDANGRAPAGVPGDADILPLRTIWRAFRKLGDSLHWQDINRVLGHLSYEHEVDPAIDRIAAFRRLHGTGYPTDPSLLAALGASTLSEDPRHITPWFNRAGIGGLLIPSETNDAGFRSLPPSSASIIDSLLAEPTPIVPAEARLSRDAYISYLMRPVEASARANIDPNDRKTVSTILDAVRDFGGKRIIALAGLPGTGKSRLARLVAEQLTDGDPGRLKDIQFHESTSYEDFMEGFVPRPDGLGFERRDKTFRIINQRANDDPQRSTHVLLIEEFTRANVHSVLGELLTFIEHRGRKFTLSLSQEEISIAPNLVVIATMNPRDRSALTLDDAITRRMHRIATPSSVADLKNMLGSSLPTAQLDRLVAWFEQYFSILPFGHGVFAGVNSALQLKNVFDGTVTPLLSDPLGQISDGYKQAYQDFPFRSPQAGSPAPE